MTHPARQHARQLLLDALHRAWEQYAFRMPADVAEKLTDTVQADLAQHHAFIYAYPDATTRDPDRVTDVAHRLHTLGGPVGASRTVLADRAELHHLADILDNRGRTAEPFTGDMLDYTELPPQAIAWRALLGVLATTGSSVTIPGEHAPAAWVLEVVAGWTLRPDVHADPDTGTIVLTAHTQQLPALQPTPGCTGVSDADLNVYCRGPADRIVRYLNADGDTINTDSDPVCGAHAFALHRRAERNGITTRVDHIEPPTPHNPTAGQP